MAIEEWYRQLPIVTRTYVTLAFITTAGCALEIITPFNVYYNSKLIFQKYELWRLLTNFFYFGSFGVDFVFHMFFLLKYCKSLEEASFRGRSADFMWMLMLGGGMLLSVAPFVNVQFFGASLTFMMVYVWGRRHQYINLSFLGIFNFTAPYLPWVLLSFSLLLGSSPVIDLLGMGAGHIYYFLEDVYPRMSGRRVLKTPGIVRALFPAEEPIGLTAVPHVPHVAAGAAGGLEGLGDEGGAGDNNEPMPNGDEQQQANDGHLHED